MRSCFLLFDVQMSCSGLAFCCVRYFLEVFFLRSAPFVRFTAVLTAVLLLLFSVTFPVAQAFEPATISAAVVAVSATIAIGSILVGLGILPGADATQFNLLIEDIKDGLSDTWAYVTDAGEKFVKMLTISDQYFAQKELIDEILADAFSSGLITLTPIISFEDGYSSSSFYDQIFYILSALYPDYLDQCRYFYELSSFHYLLSPSEKIKIVGTMATVYYCDSWYLQYSRSTSNPWSASYLDGPSPQTRVYNLVATISGFECVAAENLELGELGTTLDDTVYATWVENPLVSAVYGGSSDDSGTSDGDGDDNVPIGLSHVPLLLLSDWAGLNQQYIQAGGQSELAPEDVIDLGELVELDPETVPDDLLDGGSGGSGDTGTDSGSGSGGSGDITVPDSSPLFLDLTKFFPFCIPFDLYKILQSLCVEPEAPKFEFSVPYGGTFVVDLSVWDDVAALLRQCQFFLFCFGLYKLTSKVIRW